LPARALMSLREIVEIVEIVGSRLSSRGRMLARRHARMVSMVKSASMGGRTYGARAMRCRM